MAAWRHSKYWDSGTYDNYRTFVRLRAESYMGRKEDCADLSVTMMIDFAATNGLPLTFTDNDGVRYISKGTEQTPDAQGCGLSKSWGNSKAGYAEAVLNRIGAKALTLRNMDINPRGPEPGDLLLKETHAALIFNVYRPQVVHPLWVQFEENNPPKPQAMIPLFPGDEMAGRQGDQLRYYRDPINRSDFIGPPAPKTHIDYLNHRGSMKPKAELIYWADPAEDALKDLSFYKYSAKVLDNWIDWDGSRNPTR